MTWHRCCYLAVASLVHVTASEVWECPSVPTGISMYAWVKLKVTAHTSCDNVKTEMLARVSGQWAHWYDPAGNGTYALLAHASDSASFSRRSANGQYTDKQVFTFTPILGGDACELRGCSRSQVSSYSDFGTNYCNLWNLFCGKSESCCPVQHDFMGTSVETEKSMGASVQNSVCRGVGGGSGVFGEPDVPPPCNFDGISHGLGTSSTVSSSVTSSTTSSTSSTSSERADVNYASGLLRRRPTTVLICVCLFFVGYMADHS